MISTVRPSPEQELERSPPPPRDSYLGLMSVNLDALPAPLPRLPRKLEIPPCFQDRFAELRRKVTERVQSLGPPKKVSDALWCLALEINEGVLRPGFLGRERVYFTERMNRMFGAGNWSMKHLLKGRLVDTDQAISLYEEAYYQFLKDHPEKLRWLTTNFKDVIDNADSNVESGLDYRIQEVPDRGHHLHDIAIRRSVDRLGMKFSGTEVLQVRSKFSKKGSADGFFLSPGEVPFHNKDLIQSGMHSAGKSWWQPGSIEDFYQSTRRIVVPEVANDASFSENLQQSQTRESYLHRVAARMTLRSLLVMLEPQATLTDVAYLPWMMDYNSFPIGQDGLPRQFSNDEIIAILNSSYEQLAGLLGDSSESNNPCTKNAWGSFRDAKEFISAITANQNGALSDELAERYPDIVEIAEWSTALPLFQSFFNSSNSRPLFLARDGLAIMEYMTYAMLIQGSTRADANEALQRTIYLPGSPNKNTTKNQRAHHPLFDTTTYKVSEIWVECKRDLLLYTPPKDADTRGRLHELFEVKAHELLRTWRDTDNPDEKEIANSLYEFWFDAYSSIKSRFGENLHGVTLVDSDGSGKTALFIRSVLTFFAKERGDAASIDILLGALQPDNLGVPNLAEMHGLHDSLPDVRWPFRFQNFQTEPIFGTRQTPKNILALIYRSLSYYNTAVNASLMSDAQQV